MNQTTNSPPPEAERCDVPIVGGGPAGATPGDAAGPGGRDVVLLERTTTRASISANRCCRPTCRCWAAGRARRGRGDRHARWCRIRLAAAHPPHLLRVRRRLGQDAARRLAGAALRLRPHPCGNAARQWRACSRLPGRKVTPDADGADEAVHEAEPRRLARATWSTPPAATPCWPTSSAGSSATSDTTAPRCSATSPARSGSEGKKEGNISLFWFKHGWFWFIRWPTAAPASARSAGRTTLKSRDKPLKDFFLDTIAMAPPLAERLAGATLVGDAVYATGNYAYGSPAGPRATASCSPATPTPSSTRCSPAASTSRWRTRSKAPGSWPPRSTGRPGGGRPPPLRSAPAARAGRVLVVHLPHDQPGAAPPLHEPGEPAAGEGGGAVGAGRRHLRRFADRAFAGRLQGHLLHRLAGAAAAGLCGLARTAQQHPRRRGRAGRERDAGAR